MIVLHNSNWKHVLTDEGIHPPSLLRIGSIVLLLLISYLLSGCDTDPLQTDTSVTDFWKQPLRTDSKTAITAMVYNGQDELIVAQQGEGIQRYEEVDGDFFLLSSVSVGDNNITELCSDSTTGFLYAGTYSGSLFRSTDYGVSWTDITPDFADGVLGEGLLNYVAGIGTGSNYLVFAAFNGQGIYYTDDFGSSWRRILGPPNIEGVTSMAVFPDSTNDVLYVGTQNVGIFWSSTYDGSTYWTVTTGWTPFVTRVHALDGSVYYGQNSGIISSFSENTFDEAAVLPAAIIDMVHSPGGAVYAAVHEHGVYRIGAGSGTAEEVNIALYDRNVRCLTVDPDGYLLAGTETEGVFRSVFPISFYDE